MPAGQGAGLGVGLRTGVGPETCWSWMAGRVGPRRGLGLGPVLDG